jgi:glycosyltransferase involved in cell wall biosynthesis
MNILMFIDSLKGGGAEIVTLALARSFVELGHSVHIVIMRDLCVFDDELEGIHVHPVEKGLTRIKGGVISRWLFARKLFRKFKHLEKKYGDFSLKISHMPFPNFITRKAGIGNVVAVVHNNFSHSLRKMSFFKRARRIRKYRETYDDRKVVCVSKGVAKDLKDTLELSNEPFVIYNPYMIDDIKRLSYMESEAMPETNYIVHVGRFIASHKRQDILVEAFDRIKDKVDVDLVFIGSGEFEDDVKSMVNKKGIDKRVHFLGWQKNPYPFIRNAKILVLCSQHEGFGGVLVESIVCGTTPVSTDCDFGPSEILVEELKDFLTPVNDVDGLAETIIKALESEVQLDEKYYKKFDAKNVAKAYLELAG